MNLVLSLTLGSFICSIGLSHLKIKISSFLNADLCIKILKINFQVFFF